MLVPFGAGSFLFMSYVFARSAIEVAVEKVIFVVCLLVVAKSAFGRSTW